LTLPLGKGEMEGVDMKPRIHSHTKYKILRKKLRNNCTKAEYVLWKQIRNSQVGYKFRRQQSIGKYIVDFYCPETKLIIELDGSIHGEKEVAERDIEKQCFLESNGLILVRYRNEQIKYDLDSVLYDIIRRCDESV
jgi:very-short-patch-repair endonuclease